jgi:membrane-associated protein
MVELFNISNLITNYGYIGVFSIVFLESGIFFALPGDSLLFTAGLLASTGYLNLFILIPGTFVATFFGGIVGYYIGVHIDRLRKYNFFNRILKEEYIKKAHEFFEKYGRSAILFSRFVPIVRTFTPIVAGIAEMDYKAFLKYSLISSVLWSTTVTLVGFFLGRIFPQIEHYMSYVIILVVVLSLLPAVIEMFRKKKD